MKCVRQTQLGFVNVDIGMKVISKNRAEAHLEILHGIGAVTVCELLFLMAFSCCSHNQRDLPHTGKCKRKQKINIKKIICKIYYY